MRRRSNAHITKTRTTALGPLSVVRCRDLPPAPDDVESIVSAINHLEQYLEETAVPSIPAEERRAHLRLLKTVA